MRYLVSTSCPRDLLVKHSQENKATGTSVVSKIKHDDISNVLCNNRTFLSIAPDHPSHIRDIHDLSIPILIGVGFRHLTCAGMSHALMGKDLRHALMGTDLDHAIMGKDLDHVPLGKVMDHVPSIDNQRRTGLSGRLRKVHVKILGTNSNPSSNRMRKG